MPLCGTFRRRTGTGRPSKAREKEGDTAGERHDAGAKRADHRDQPDEPALRLEGHKDIAQFALACAAKVAPPPPCFCCRSFLWTSVELWR